MLNLNNNKINMIFSLITLLLLYSLIVPGYASDLSDASALRERCEKEILGLEVSVKNFGDNVDIEEFQKGEQSIKLGKVKFIQSKFTEAIEIYNKYLTLQYNLYEILAKKYIDRTEKINDAVGEDLVDFINDKKVVEYLRLATQNLKDAKAAMATKHYKNIIDVCRSAKNYALGTYKIAGKPVPEQYKKDVTDNEGKIFKQENNK
jgi:hypothetical protein